MGFFSSSPTPVVQTQPTSSALQQLLYNWLTGGAGNTGTQPASGTPGTPGYTPAVNFTGGPWMYNNGAPTLTGIPQYPGQLSPDVSKTILPSVYGAFSPTNPGTDFLTNFLQSSDPNKANPFLSSLMSRGTMPGRAGNYENNLAAYGVASPISGSPLMNLAYGKPDQTAAQYLLPFLTGNNPAAYKPPTIG